MASAVALFDAKLSSSSIVVIPTNPDCPAVPTLRVVIVEIPDTFTLSSSVCPSTSKFPFASIAPVNVETPATCKCSNVPMPAGGLTPVAPI